MESKDELKEIDIKNRTRCYFDDIIKVQVFILVILLDEKLYKNIQFMTFQTKLQQIQNHCVLDWIK